MRASASFLPPRDYERRGFEIAQKSRRRERAAWEPAVGVAREEKGDVKIVVNPKRLA